MGLLTRPDFRDRPVPEPPEAGPVGPAPVAETWPEDWRDYLTEEFPHLTDQEIFDYLDERLDGYLAPDPGPRLGPKDPDRYRTLWQELLLLAGGHLDLVARWLEERLDNWTDWPRTEEERRAVARASSDPWAGWPKLPAKKRGELAASGLPFWVRDVRYRTAGAYRQSKNWERKTDTWQLLIESPHTGLCVLVLAVGSVRRDEQCRWLQERCDANRPLEVPLRLFWETLPSGHRRLALTRTLAEGRLYDPTSVRHDAGARTWR